MYKCFKCSEELISVDILLVHIKYVHRLGTNDVFECGQFGCPQSFSSKRNFVFHLNNAHKRTKEITAQNLNSRQNLLVPENKIDLHDKSDTKLTVDQIKDDLYKNALTFVSHLNSYSHLTNKQIESILNEFSENISHTFMLIKDVVIQEINLEKKDYVSQIFDVCADPFKNIKTEYKLIKALGDRNLMQPPVQFTVQKLVQENMRKGESHLEEVESKVVVSPIIYQIKTFFELPNILTDVRKHMEKLQESTSLTNFIQGDLWKSKTSNFKDKIVIPYFLYYDDVEVNDPLGSHTGVQSIASFYYSFPVLSLEMLSKLEYIFPAMFLKTSVLKKVGSNIAVNELIKIIKDIEKNGIEIRTNEGILQVYFVLGLVIGDNKALNDICCFSKSFSHNYYCRFCLKHKKISQQLAQEDSSCLRNPKNYREQIVLNDYKATGIHSESIFNTIPSFHVTENFSVDVMHDAFEGIIKYGLVKALNYFILNNFFDLETFNLRLRNFNYGQIESANRCEAIKEQHLKAQKLHLSSREAYSLLHFFTLLVGDLINKNNEIWKYTLILERLVDNMLLPVYTEDCIKNFSEIIKKHHELYIKVFESNLTPKHHIITHYSSIIRKSGPLRHLWCMRFESKNREMKNYTNVTSSRRNLALSVAKKFAMKFSYFILKSSLQGIHDNSNSNVSSLEFLRTKAYFKTLADKFTISQLQCASILEKYYFNGSMFLTDLYLFKNNRLFKILEVIKINEIVYLILNSYNIKFEDNLNCFLISEMVSEIFVIEITQFVSKPFQIFRLFNGTKCFKPRYL